ncbi:MAG: acyl-CoA thioester hydrolase/BAAT C-terminal domain-containing protein [Oscillospiraceae bacterium]
MENFTIENDGFFGKSFIPTDNKYPEKAMIAFIGSNGDFANACKLGEYFSNLGLTSIAIAYWNVESLPKVMTNLPLESVENAAKYLKSKGFSKIGVCGISKGGELALLSASMFHEINGVIAISPNYAACIGFNGIKEVNHSTWTYKGKEIPYTKAHMSLGRAILKTLSAAEMTTNFIYEDALAKVNPESIIPVENISGAILLVSAEYDSMWPSKHSCEKIMERLNLNNFPYPYKHLNYKYASHMILPFASNLNHLYKIERKNKIECQQSRDDLIKNIENWILNW